MRGKKILSRLWWGGLVILAVLWAQAPVMAQEEVTDELAGVKAALTGQMFVVEQLKSNFDSLFGIASELEGEVTSLTEEVDSLKGNIESLTEKFLRVTEELQARMDSLEAENTELQTQIDSLTADNTEFQAQISSLKAQRLILGLGFLVALWF